MDITCPYCNASQEATVVICKECNKYWFIRDLRITERIENYYELYHKLFSDEFKERFSIYEKFIGIFRKIRSFRLDIKHDVRLLLNDIYKKSNIRESVLFDLERLKDEFKTYNTKQLNIERIKFLSTRTYLSSLYDCKALIESKRDSIPSTFENNRRLIKIIKTLNSTNYINLEISLLEYNKSISNAGGDMYFSIYAIIHQEVTYLCLECILVSLEHFSEIDIEEKCKEIYNIPVYGHYGRDIIDRIRELLR